MHKLDNLYAGLPIFILSTGTSLRGFDFRRLDGRITIGINRIIEYYHPSIVHFVDIRAHGTHARALRGYNGMILTGRGCRSGGSHNGFFPCILSVLPSSLTSMSLSRIEPQGRRPRLCGESRIA